MLKSFLLFHSQLERLQQQIRDQRKEHRKEKEAIVEDFSKQINELEERLTDKTKEVEVMQSELKMVKEFRRKRGQMQKDLDEVCCFHKRDWLSCDSFIAYKNSCLVNSIFAMVHLQFEIASKVIKQVIEKLYFRLRSRNILRWNDSEVTCIR